MYLCVKIPGLNLAVSTKRLFVVELLMGLQLMTVYIVDFNSQFVCCLIDKMQKIVKNIDVSKRLNKGQKIMSLDFLLDIFL